MKDFGHNTTVFDPYYGDTYVGPRVQAIASDPNTSIITANHDRRKSGGVSGY